MSFISNPSESEEKIVLKGIAHLFLYQISHFPHISNRMINELYVSLNFILTDQILSIYQDRYLKTNVTVFSPKY